MCGIVEDKRLAQYPICLHQVKNWKYLKMHYGTQHKGHPSIPANLVGDEQEIEYICNICTKGFAKKLNLRRHIENVHPTVQSDDNSGSGSGSDSGSDEDISEMQREVVMPFQCDVCGSSFAQKQALYNHIAQEHDDEVEVEDEILDEDGEEEGTEATDMCLGHVCSACGAVFRRRPRLEEHVFQNHMNLNRNNKEDNKVDNTEDNNEDNNMETKEMDPTAATIDLDEEITRESEQPTTTDTDCVQQQQELDLLQKFASTE